MSAPRRIGETLPQLVLGATLFGLLALAELAPARFERVMQEDGWAEWATFSSFFIAFVVALRELLRTLRRPASDSETRAPFSLTQLALAGLALFCLFVAGEEISWGQRLLGFRPAAVFLENNYQQEANLHNLLKGVFETRWMVLIVCVSYGVLAPYAAHVTRFPRVLAAPLSLLPWFVATAWLEFAYPYELVGELAELLLGLLFLTDMMLRQAELTDTSRPRARWLHEPENRAALALLGALVLALCCLPLNEVSLRANTDELVAHTQADLEALGERMQRGDTLRDSLFRKREIHKRLYTAVKAGYLDLEREEFYLDAWNSPYWISFARGKEQGTGRVLLYSFGPNRRRELDPQRSDGLSSMGDDVQLSIDVALPARAAR